MSRARGIVARYGQCADTERGYGGLGVVYQSLAQSDALIGYQYGVAMPRDRAALDGKTVHCQRVALPYYRSVMGPIAGVEQVRPGMSGVFAPSDAFFRNVGATCATWLRCAVFSVTWRFLRVGRFCLQRGTCLELNLGFGSAYSPRFTGSPCANEPAPKPRGSARERSGRVFGVSGCRKAAIALYGALTRSQGVSGETGARLGSECALSPRGRPVRRDAGVRGWFALPGWGGHSAALSVAVGHLPYGPLSDGSPCANEPSAPHAMVANVPRVATSLAAGPGTTACDPPHSGCA